MNKHLLILLIVCMGAILPQVVFGDTIPTKGRWGDEDYRSITTLPPTLSIDNNVLSVEFMDALNNLTVHITDGNGNIMYENTLSGERGDVINIPVDGMRTGVYQIVLTHSLGWLVGEFENQ